MGAVNTTKPPARANSPKLTSGVAVNQEDSVRGRSTGRTSGRIRVRHDQRGRDGCDRARPRAQQAPVPLRMADVIECHASVQHRERQAHHLHANARSGEYEAVEKV